MKKVSRRRNVGLSEHLRLVILRVGRRPREKAVTTSPIMNLETATSDGSLERGGDISYGSCSDSSYEVSGSSSVGIAKDKPKTKAASTRKVEIDAFIRAPKSA
jgi:hypothetical protein